jgi:hypothetical protein
MTIKESKSWFFVGAFTFLVLVISGCAGIEKKEPKIKAGAYLNHLFPVERETPERPANQDEFYFKHCSQNFWRTIPTRNDYSCTEL